MRAKIAPSSKTEARDLHMRLVLGGCRSPYPSGRTVNVYTEALMGFSHVHCSDGLSYPYSLKAASLKQLWL